jgi:glucokinase
VTKSIGMLVAGEIGPRESRLALCGLDMGRAVVVVEETMQSERFLGLGPMVHRFLAKHRPPQIRGAAFVVGGSVRDGVSLAANLPWPVEASAIRSEVGIERVSLLNDVEATAQALPILTEEDLLVVSAGEGGEPGNQAVVSAGGCPGMSGLYWNGTEHRTFVSEGGHADFAPSDESEMRLALALSAQVARVTVELLLSTAGLALIYRHLRSAHAGDESEELSEALKRADASMAAALAASSDPVCRDAVEMFVSLIGSAAGNLALTFRATGGMYLTGDVVLALRAHLISGVFASAFSRKAPMQELLGKIPVYAILNPRAALLGAATVAARDLRTKRVGGWAS